VSQPQAPWTSTAPPAPVSDYASRFAPPQAEVAIVVPEQAQGRPMWFSVGPLKMVVMCMVTMQFYSVYWFYKQWKLVREREQSSIIPALRALFGIFFVYALCTRVHASEGSAGAKLNVPALAGGWIVTTVLWKLPDPYWWVAMAAPLFMMPVQAAMNAVNEAAAPGHDPNRRFSAWNWVAIVLGSLLLVMALIGTFMPEQA
jgi:hypothetical protein